MKTGDEIGRRRAKRERDAEVAARLARSREAVEAAQPAWGEMTRVEQALEADLARVRGQLGELIATVRSQTDMTAVQIAAELKTDVKTVRRFMFATVSSQSRTEPTAPAEQDLSSGQPEDAGHRG